MNRAPIAVVCLALLAACHAGPSERTGDIPRRGTNPSMEVVGVTAFTDPATGCEYLVIAGSMTARYEDGGRASNGAALTRVRGCQ